MRTKFEFGAALAALALVSTACFGGGGDDATLALDGAAIADVSEVAVADLPPEPLDEAAAPPEAETEPGGEAEATVVSTPQPESYTYAGDAEKAASMVLVPADVGDDYPGLIVDSLNTGEVDNLMAAAREIDHVSPAVALITGGRITGYESVMVPSRGTEVADGSLLVSAGAVGPIWSRVDLFSNEEDAASWVATERIFIEHLPAENVETQSVEDAAGLPGDGYVAVYTTTGTLGTAATMTEVGFSRGKMAASVRVAGERPDDAIALARALALRTYDVQQAAVPARNPSPEMGLHVPQQHLDSFRALAEVAILDGDQVVWRWRESGVMQDADHYSCKATSSVGGTETLEWDLTVDGDTAWYYADQEASEKVDTLSDGVAELVGSCPANPDFWRTRILYGFDGLPAGRGSTAVGPATAYQTSDIDAVNAAFGWQTADGETLVNYQEYVAEDGWTVASYHERTMPRRVVESAWGSIPGSSSQLTVHATYRVTDANAEDLELTSFIEVEAAFGLAVGEVILLVPEPEPEPEVEITIEGPSE